MCGNRPGLRGRSRGIGECLGVLPWRARRWWCDRYTADMTKFGGMVRFVVAAAMVPVMMVQPSLAWGTDGHKMINRLAAANLPKDVPAFLRNGNALDTMEYLGPEPDRWRNKAEEDLVAAQAPEHFIDLEWADLIGPLPKKRYDYIRALEKAQAA